MSMSDKRNQNLDEDIFFYLRIFELWAGLEEWNFDNVSYRNRLISFSFLKISTCVLTLPKAVVAQNGLEEEEAAEEDVEEAAMRVK